MSRSADYEFSSRVTQTDMFLLTQSFTPDQNPSTSAATQIGSGQVTCTTGVQTVNECSFAKTCTAQLSPRMALTSCGYRKSLPRHWMATPDIFDYPRSILVNDTSSCVTDSGILPNNRLSDTSALVTPLLRDSGTEHSPPLAKCHVAAQTENSGTNTSSDQYSADDDALHKLLSSARPIHDLEEKQDQTRLSDETSGVVHRLHRPSLYTSVLNMFTEVGQGNSQCWISVAAQTKQLPGAENTKSTAIFKSGSHGGEQLTTSRTPFRCHTVRSFVRHIKRRSHRDSFKLRARSRSVPEIRTHHGSANDAQSIVFSLCGTQLSDAEKLDSSSDEMVLNLPVVSASGGTPKPTNETIPPRSPSRVLWQGYCVTEQLHNTPDEPRCEPEIHSHSATNQTVCSKSISSLPGLNGEIISVESGEDPTLCSELETAQNSAIFDDSLDSVHEQWESPDTEPNEAGNSNQWDCEAQLLSGSLEYSKRSTPEACSDRTANDHYDGKSCKTRKITKPLPRKPRLVPNRSQTEEESPTNLDVLWEPLQLSQEIPPDAEGKQLTKSDNTHVPTSSSIRNGPESMVQTVPHKGASVPLSVRMIKDKQERKRGRSSRKAMKNDGEHHLNGTELGDNHVLTSSPNVMIARPVEGIMPNKHQLDNSSQLRYVYRLCRANPPSLSEVRMALPSVKALAHDPALLTDESRSLIGPITSLVSRLERASESLSPEDPFQLTVQERRALVGALQATNLLSEANGQVSDTMKECGMEQNGVSGQSTLPQTGLDGVVVEKKVRLLVDLLLDAASGNRMNRDTYNQIRQHIAMLINPRSDSSSVLETDLAAPYTLVHDLKRFINRMDGTFDKLNEVPINMQLHNTIGELVTRLNPLITGFDSQSLEFGLQTLYDAATSPEALQTQEMRLDRLTSMAILRGLEQAVREHQLRATSAHEQGASLKNMWSVVNQLINRLSHDMSKELSEDQVDCSILHPKEGILVQHILLGILSNHGLERTTEEQEADSAFFQFCSTGSDMQHISSDKSVNLFYGIRSPELLSPISELCTPETSTYDTEHTTPEVVNGSSYSHTALPGISPSCSLKMEQRGMNQDSERTMVNANVRSVCESNLYEPRTLHQNEIVQLPEATIHHLESTKSDESKSTILVNRSTVRQLATYLRSKLLESITMNRIQANSQKSGTPLEHLSSVLDKSLIEITTGEYVELPMDDVKAIESILVTDNTPYARILRRSLESSVASSPSIGIRKAEEAVLPLEAFEQIPLVPCPSTSPIMHSLLMNVIEQRGRYISPDQLKKLSSVILQIRLPSTNLTEMANSWQNTNEPVLITEAIATELKHAATSLCEQITVDDRTQSAEPKGEQDKCVVTTSIPTDRIESTPEIGKPWISSVSIGENNLTQVTGATEILQTLNAYDMDWSDFSPEEQKIITNCITLLNNTYPQLQLSNLKDTVPPSQMCPRLREVISRVSKLTDYSQRWTHTIELLKMRTKSECARLDSEAEMAQLADALKASVVRGLSQHPNCLLEPSQAVSALDLVCRLTETSQTTRKSISLEPSEQRVIEQVYDALVKSDQPDMQTGRIGKGSLSILNSVLMELCESCEAVRSDEIVLRPNTCVTLLSFLSQLTLTDGDKTGLTEIKCQLIQALCSTTSKIQRSTLDQWRTIISQTTAERVSTEKIIKDFQTAQEILASESTSEPLKKMRKFMGDCVVRRTSLDSLAPGQLIRLIRDDQLLSSDVALEKGELREFIKDSSSLPSDSTRASNNGSKDHAYLAMTNMRAFLTIERPADSGGRLFIGPKECAQLWEDADVLIQSNMLTGEEHTENGLIHTAKEQLFVGAVNGAGLALESSIVDQLTTQLNRIGVRLEKERKEQEPGSALVLSESNVQPGLLSSYVQSRLQHYILSQPISFQAWHCVHELAEVLSTASATGSETRNHIQTILARLLIYTEECETFDITQKSIALAQLNMTKMWLEEHATRPGRWTLADGYTFAFVLSQLAWRNPAATGDPDPRIIFLLTQWLRRMQDTGRIDIPPGARHSLASLLHDHIGQLRSAMVSGMEHKVWTNLFDSDVQTDTSVAIRRQQGIALIALLTTMLNLSADNSETLPLWRAQCIALINDALKQMQSTQQIISIVDLERLQHLFQTNAQPSDPVNISQTRLLEAMESGETVSEMICTGVLQDRTEAFTLFSHLFHLELLVGPMKDELGRDLRIARNLLSCLLASNSDVFPFSLDASLTGSMLQLVDHVNERTRKPMEHVILDGLSCLQLHASSKMQSSEMERAQFVRTSTPVSELSQTDNIVSPEDTIITLTTMQQGRVVDALKMTLACVHALTSKQTKDASDLLLQLQTTNSESCVMNTGELVKAAQLFNSVLYDSSGQRLSSSDQSGQLTQEPVSSVLLEHIILRPETILAPCDALELNSTLTLAVQQPQVQQELSQNEKRSLAAVRRRLLFAAIRGEPMDVSSVRPLIQRVSDLVNSDQKESGSDTVIRRLKTLARPQMISEQAQFDAVQQIDPETSDLLHQCLHEQLRTHPTTLATTIPIMSIITELEAATESATDREYASFTLSPTELRTVIEFLQTSSIISPESISIKTSEQITALLLVRNAANGEPIWPSESRLLLSALETLSRSNQDASRFIASKLCTLRARLLSSADLEESVQNLYEGSGFIPSEVETAQLKTLCALVTPGIDLQIAQLFDNISPEVKRSRSSRSITLDREQLAELCRIYLLHVCSTNVPRLQELALMNRVACGLSSESNKTELLPVVASVCHSSPIRFSEANIQIDDDNRLGQITRTVPAFVPDLLEQALGHGETQLSFRPNGSFLISNILTFLALLDFQPGCDRLVPRWSSHLKRLALQILYSALVSHSVRLDVRSRALLSIAYKYYRSTLTDVSQDMVDAADEALHGKTTLLELDASNRSTVAECLSVALASPMRYNLSPVRAGFIASLAEALQTASRQITFDAGDMQLVCETVHSLCDLESKVRECPSDTFTLLSCLQTVEQFLELHEQRGSEGTVFTRRDAAVVAAALEVLINVALEEPRFNSWDSDDPTILSEECKSSLGLTQCFLSSLAIGASLSGVGQHSANLTATEISCIKQLVNYWKPRLLLDAQRQRTASIRKLSVSTECDLSADINNQQLANAVQLTVIHGKIAQPQDAWLCIQTLEQLVRSPANEYISISNLQRDALRLAMCPVRSAGLPSSASASSSMAACLSDANLLACMIYLHRILTASTTSTFGHRTRFCVQPADVAAFATSLRTLLDNFVGDLTHKEAFAVLRVMEQRMRCTAASLEAYWITQAESRAIREVLHYLYTNTGNAATNQLSSLLSRFERSYASVHATSNMVELINQEQNQLLQALRTYILLVPDALPVDYGKLIDLIDYLMYARPALLTENHLTLVRELLRSDLPRLAVQSHRQSSAGPRLNALRSSLNHLTRQNRTLTSNQVPTFLSVHPCEAASLFCVLNTLNACAKCVDPSLILLQSALAHCVANGHIWTTWSALPPNSQLRIRQALSNCVDDLVERLCEINVGSWSAREWSSLELAREHILRLLETPDSVLLGEGLSSLRLVCLLIPEDQPQGVQGATSRPILITRYRSISGDVPEVEEPDSASLLEAIQCIETSVLCDQVQLNVEDCLESLKAVHILRSATETLQLASRDQLLLQELETALFDIAARLLKEGHSSQSLRSELQRQDGLPFYQIGQIFGRIQTQWAAHVANHMDKQVPDTSDICKISPPVTMEQDTSKTLSCDILESGQASTSSAMEVCQPMEEIHRALGRFLTLCNARILQPEEITELTMSVDLLHRATNQLTSRLRGYAQFSPIERDLLRNLQFAMERNQGYTLSPEAADILQTLGQRLSTLAMQANQDLLRNGLELWLTASVDGRFVFDDRETQQLHSALCLARDTLRKDRLRTASEDALGIVDRVIEQFSSTVDSGIGAEITGPHCLGPAVTEVLENAQRAHELMSLPGSTISVAPSTSSEWCVQLHRADGLQRQDRITDRPGSNATDDDGTFEQLETDEMKPVRNNERSIAQPELELSRICTSDGNVATGTIDCPKETTFDRNVDGTALNRRHTIDQAVSANLGMEKSPTFTPAILASLIEEQKRLKTWEKMVESRLEQACKRIETLLAALPKPNEKSATEIDNSLITKSAEVQQLRAEVLKLKEQLEKIVGQLEAAERLQRKQVQFASSMRELMENQQQLRLQLLSERAGLFSADATRREPLTKKVDSDNITRLYRSSDCIKELSPFNVIHPHHSQVVLYKPIESETLDLSLTSETQQRFSSLDRLHELIEIRRAVVAGSREELCRLGVYSSLPLRLGRIPPPIQRPSVRQVSEGSGNSGVRTEAQPGSRLLHRLLERQRNYTKNLLGRASYEQDQSSRVLDALEERLTNLEQQVTTTDPTTTSESRQTLT